MQERVAAAIEVAERLTAVALAATHDNIATSDLVAVVMAPPEIKSVGDLAGKSVAIDERYSPYGLDVWVMFVAAGTHSVEVSVGRTAAIDRLSNGEVAAAVLALVSADAAEGFPEIPGFNIFRVPLPASKDERSGKQLTPAAPAPLAVEPSLRTSSPGPPHVDVH